MRTAGWTRDGSLQDFIRFGGHLGTCVYSIFEFKKLKMSFFVRACFQVIFLSISASTFQRLGFSNRDFHMESIVEIDFSPTSFLMNFGIDFCCFLEALGAAFLFFFAWKTELKTERFLVI